MCKKYRVNTFLNNEAYKISHRVIGVDIYNRCRYITTVLIRCMYPVEKSGAELRRVKTELGGYKMCEWILFTGYGGINPLMA